MRPFLLLGPIAFLTSCAAALAQDAALAPTATTGTPPLDYVIGLGPIGALVWGAFVLGKGVNVTINHKHDVTPETLSRIVSALRKRGLADDDA